MKRKNGIRLWRQWLWNDQEMGLVGGDVVVLSVSALIYEMRDNNEEKEWDWIEETVAVV